MDYSPGLGGGRLQPDRRIWSDLLAGNSTRRRDAVATIKAQQGEGHYRRHLLDRLTELTPVQRGMAGKALSLLGDPRFSPPLYESEMIYMQPMRVIIGSGGHPSESPLHRLRVDHFSLAQYPVTEMAYQVYVASTGVEPPLHWEEGAPADDCLNCPVTHVSALEAEAYAAWLTEQTGHIYRLPTEAEWTLAARGANDRRRVPWEDGASFRHANVWTWRSPREVVAVGMFPEGRGPFNHGDMVGNVWEWLLSTYAPYPYRPADGRDRPGATGPRTLRGGSFRSRPSAATVSVRMGEPAGDRFAYAGFRLVREAE